MKNKKIPETTPKIIEKIKIQSSIIKKLYILYYEIY